MCPARLPPPAQDSLRVQAVWGVWGRGGFLPVPVYTSRTSPCPRAAGQEDHRAPPLPTHLPAQRTLPSLPIRPGSGRFLLGPTAPVWPVWEVAGREGEGGGWRRDPVEPLPRGLAAEAQTFPYVVALQAAAGVAPWGCWTRPGDGDHPGLRGGPLPNGISASSYGLDKAERPMALIFVPWNVSPRRKWPLLLNQTLSPHNFPCICGKVSLRSEVQAWAGRGGGVGCLAFLPGAPSWPLPSPFAQCSTLVCLGSYIWPKG